MKLMYPLFEIRQFHPTDISTNELQSTQRNIDHKAILDIYESKGYHASLFCSDKWLGSCGIIKVWDKRFSAWAVFPTKMPNASMLYFTRGVDSFLTYALSLGIINRVEMTTVVGNDRAFRWATILGFNYEGKMAQYDPEGRDHYLFSRVSCDGRNNLTTHRSGDFGGWLSRWSRECDSIRAATS